MRRGIPKPDGGVRPLGIPTVRDRVAQQAARLVLEPIFGVSWRSCDRLAGESPATVMAKQPCSWWPAEGETRPSERHDKVPLGGEQATGPYEEEPCRLVRLACVSRHKREPSSAKMGEGHGRREDLGGAAPTNPPGYGGRNGCTADHGTGEIRLGTGSERPRVANPRCPVAAKPISSDPAKRRSAERKSEGAIGSWDGVDDITRQSEGPLAGCASRTRTAAGLLRRDRGHSPAHREVARSSTGIDAWVVRQRRGAAECGRPTARGRAG